MNRIRTLFFLIPLVVLSQTAQVVQAAPQASKLAWTPGLYMGTISINAHEYIALKPLPKGTLHEEQDLEILFSTGPMYIIVDGQGRMNTFFWIPLRFTYMYWGQLEDIGSGICEGQHYESSGNGTLRFSYSGTAGNKFSGKAHPFKVQGFIAVIMQFGKRCPEINVERMRSEMQGGFATMFNHNIDFEVKMTKGDIVAGYCYLKGYELEGDHAFDCTWYGQRVPNRKD